VTCSFRASGTRRAKAGACKSRLAGPRCGNAPAAANATGIGWCRRVAGRKPHSRARIDGSSGVPVRQNRLQKSANGVEVQRSVLPAGCGARGQEPSSHGLRKESRGGFKGVDNRHRGGQAAEPGKARAGRLRGRCGAKVLRQTEGIPGRSSARSFTRTGRRRSRRPSRISRTRERQGKRGGGDRDVRGSVGTHRNGKKTPATMTVRKRTRATRQSELHCRRNRQSSFPCLRETRKRCDAAGTDEARVLVRRRENGRSRSDASRVTVIGESQGKSKIGALAEEDTAVSADARGGDSEAKTVRESRVAFYHGSKRDEETSASWWIATRRKASRSLHCRTARHGRMAV